MFENINNIRLKRIEERKKQKSKRGRPTENINSKNQKKYQNSFTKKFTKKIHKNIFSMFLSYLHN